METPTTTNEELRERRWKCERCELKGDNKMCYQHIASYLFPVTKKNVSPESAKSEDEITQKTISINSIESKKIEEGEEKNVEEQGQGNGKVVELMKCTPSVCENGAKREEKITQKAVSARLKGKSSKRKKVEEEGSGLKNSVKVKKGKALDKKVKTSRKRFRKITANGGDCDRSSEGLGSVVEEEAVERKRRKCSQNVDEFDTLLELSKQRHRKGIKIDLNTCHQCHRSDKGRVIRCTKCKSKRFCIPCITNWYPRMTEEQIALTCPFCLGNCNCKACLRMDGRIKNRLKDGFIVPEDVKIEQSRTLLTTILPFLKQFNQEQISEKEIEAKIQGKLASEVELKNAIWRDNERVSCNNCRNSIVDFHRSCPKCKYILCLTCCWEVRAGQLQGCEQVMEYVDQGFQNVNGQSSTARSKKPARGYNAPTKLEAKARRKRSLAPSEKNTTVKDARAPSQGIMGDNSLELLVDLNKAKPEWKSNNKGSIPCPPSIYEGCGGTFLELKSILSDGWVSELLNKAEKTAAKWEPENAPPAPEGCSCSVSDADSGSILRKCASREGSDDKRLYWPDARDIQFGDLKHFQWHWSRREPIIVKNVLDTTLGLSWEPMVMWRAFRQLGNSKNSTPSKVKAINCLDWSEVDLSIYQFFKGYPQGEFDAGKRKQPVLLQLKDWPPNGKFEERLSRHSAEFVRALPFKEYTHPRDGTLNLAAKLPLRTLKPDLGPKTYIAYGRAQELGCGDSISKLHCHMSDVVNILAHTTEVTLHLDRGACPSGSSEGSKDDSEGALWDIFRREDVIKLQEYLRGHHLEFMNNHCTPLKQVIHPIHDQTFYLTEEHKRKLKEEYGVEPWTFTQKLGEAVFIPAGCPHQVRNLKSCIKVALDFVSPENVEECIRVAGELRSLPRNHRAKEDKLEVWKMIIHAVKQAVKDLET
ncbi:lysine-specific demethylase JMJ26 isoform X2 [Beta vulgaris subsp. vulgaris]|uniref:lysine-specific demethylase JMJ26 isoform X2 n=1 Tax=Beta vulgaris subsp. vulgaris TaxID=3555 RepID=UPI00203750F6|nr:lysine-specific demethylase JMJ26 isoform X2 [Beta vulgaris subsp. vulgaris]